MKLKSIAVIKWKKVENIGQMKEICVHGQLFVDCLDLKISRELSKVWKKLKDTGIFIYEDFCQVTMDLSETVMGESIGTWNQHQNFLFELLKHSS